jgi:chemotaxis protein CheX
MQTGRNEVMRQGPPATGGVGVVAGAKGQAGGRPASPAPNPAPIVDVNYINPFIESVCELFTTMLGCHPKRGDVGVSKGDSGIREVTALIGLSGPVRGMVSVSFPVITALNIACKLMGRETKLVDESLSDVVAECVNIISGSAKAKLNQGGAPIDLSLPTVIRGNGYNVDYPKKTLWLEVPFTSEMGSFSLRVTIAYDGRKAGNAS